jgi:di/tricarboxylate transporter
MAVGALLGVWLDELGIHTSLEGWFQVLEGYYAPVLTLAICFLVLYTLARDLAPPDAVLLGGTVLLALAGVISVQDAFQGFSNPGVMAVGALFVVAAAMRETGLLSQVGASLLGKVRTEVGALSRLALTIVPVSAFINNTPVVAMFMPVVMDWCRKARIAPSRLLLPVSYLAIFGGVCTLIGTSTNLVVHGLMLKEGSALKRESQPNISRSYAEDLERGIGVFELAPVGVPCALAGTLFLLTIGRRWLPVRKELLEDFGEHRREYVVELQVEPHCHLIGKTIEEAGLRHLPGLFLIEIDRNNHLISPVTPDEVIQPGDRMVLAGVVSTIADLEKIPGLTPVADSAYVDHPELQRHRRLCEVVISPTSPLVGKKIREASFRALYNAAVVAVHRSGARLSGKLGDIVLQPGDTLLLQTGPGFAQAHRNNPDFYLVSAVEGSRPVRYDRARVAILLFGVLLAALVTEIVDPAVSALAIAGLMVATRCIALSDARQSVDWSTLVAIAASFGIGEALKDTGVAEWLAGGIVELTRPWGPVATLAALYGVSLLLTELLTNNAAAALMFPFCISAAEILGVSPRPFLIALAVSASCGFASPLGYQTHLMVYGPGGYRFRDFVRLGLPLDLIIWAITVAIVPLVWSF